MEYMKKRLRMDWTEETDSGTQCARRIQDEAGTVSRGEEPISEDRGVPVWMADSSLVRLLIGCCLSCTDRRDLLRKLDISVDKLTSFEVYELLTHAIKDENILSQHINEALRARLEPEDTELWAQDEATFFETCREELARGACFQKLWIAATRSDLSSDRRHELTGLVQMALFDSFGEVHSLRVKMAELSRRNAGQTRKLRELRQKLEEVRTEKDREISELRARETFCLERAAQIAEQKAWCERGPALEKENVELNDMLEEALELQTAQEARIKELTEEIERMQIAHGGCAGRCSGCDVECPVFDLCRKRVLIVGGVERMEPQYRTLVERHGGILDYHDGKMQGGARKLERSLQRADIIICPVNCNSHGACLLVKSLAKKHHKVVHLLPNASISTVTRVFGEVVDAG